ncbi:trihelix transcription factor GT-3b-like [Malania oleifera]|uniref:trihelix transcription factor GT-3b-like n=1 Tax=Malania oleifera TaxID=397392 RepID=UPI0025ADB82A|nr:trihelix transcription factor GT-3b-like [Malania oleifera]
MLGGGENEAALGRINMMGGPSLPLQLNPVAIPGDIPVPTKARDERVPQWSYQETRDLIAIRGELEKDFNLAKRNKTLWERVATKMKERGYRRTPDQCKCKWKNLVNKYKGKETSDPENGSQCPFFEELRAVYNERAKNMHRMPLESEAGSGQTKKRAKRMSGDGSSDDFSEDEDEDEDFSEGERVTKTSNPRKRKADRERQTRATTLDRTSRPSSTGSISNSTTNIGGGIKEMLQEFFQQQQRIEMQWRESMERRARERILFEQEWRQSMEKLERERLMIEQAWRERDEQRRIREDSRAEKRDALLTTLLNKLMHEK